MSMKKSTACHTKLLFYFQLKALLPLLLLATLSDSRQLSHSNDPHMNVISDAKSASSIDFSQGVEGPDGLVCVERRKTVDKTEKDQLKECFVQVMRHLSKSGVEVSQMVLLLQNVTQCYYTYVTEYSDAEQEKCEDFYWKQCKIVFKQRTYNATSR